MLTISMGNSVLRCIKYGYDLSKKKDWTTVANCPGFTPKITTKSRKPKKDNKNRASSKMNKTTFSKAR